MYLNYYNFMDVIMILCKCHLRMDGWLLMCYTHVRCMYVVLSDCAIWNRRCCPNYFVHKRTYRGADNDLCLLLTMVVIIKSGSLYFF